VTQEGAWSARQNGGQPAARDSQLRAADGIDAAVQGMQAPARDPAVDRPPAEPEGGELAAGDDAVLACCEAGDRPLVRPARRPAWTTFAPHMVVNVVQVRHSGQDDR
jgi:hypothetical protein